MSSWTPSKHRRPGDPLRPDRRRALQRGLGHDRHLRHHAADQLHRRGHFAQRAGRHRRGALSAGRLALAMVRSGLRRDGGRLGLGVGDRRGEPRRAAAGRHGDRGHLVGGHGGGPLVFRQDARLHRSDELSLRQHPAAGPPRPELHRRPGRRGDRLGAVFYNKFQAVCFDQEFAQLPASASMSITCCSCA